jgi:hypothetical protein
MKKRVKMGISVKGKDLSIRPFYPVVLDPKGPHVRVSVPGPAREITVHNNQQHPHSRCQLVPNIGE